MTDPGIIGVSRWLDALADASDQVVDALPAGVRRRQLGAWLDEAVSHVDDDLRARRFAQACPVSGLEHSAWKHRVVPFLDGALLAGIRFYGGDTARPFVDLLAWEPRVTALTDWAPVVAAVARAFGDFGPESVRVRWPGQHRPPLDRTRLTVDQHLVAGRLSTLRSAGRPWGWDSVDVRRTVSLDRMARFEERFAAWQASAGTLGRRVFPATRAQMQACVDTGVVVELWQGPQWVGWTGARRRRDRVLDGYQVVELFVDEPLRGRRRAVVLQRHLIDHLRDRGRDSLHGMIDGRNRASLRTALRSGRKICETWWFMQVAPASDGPTAGLPPGA